MTLVLKEGIVVSAAEEAVSLPSIPAGLATDVAPRGQTAIPPSREEHSTGERLCWKSSVLVLPLLMVP